MIKRKIANMISLVDERFIDEADPTKATHTTVNQQTVTQPKVTQKKKFSWKKLTAAAACICVFATALTLGILVPSLSANKIKRGVVSQELISLSENAQYLPSRELLVAKQPATKQSASLTKQSASLMDFRPPVPTPTNPYPGMPISLVNGGLTDDDYDSLIDDLSYLFTGYNGAMRISEAKEEVKTILSEGVIFDQWYFYQTGKLSGRGEYYVSNRDGVFTITRYSSFLPCIYDSKHDKSVKNEDLLEDFYSTYHKPLFFDEEYLRISIYTENDKEVVECEVVNNLNYYGHVSPISYQYTRNVKDTSFTKAVITSREKLYKHNYSYDVDTIDMPYGHTRHFVQLNYSNPDDIQWLSVTQSLPYAYDTQCGYSFSYSSRSEDGEFYCTGRTDLHRGFSVNDPSDEYLTLKPDKIESVEFDIPTRSVNGPDYRKDISRDCYVNGDPNRIEDYIYVNYDLFTAEQLEWFNKQTTAMLNSFKALAKGQIIPTDVEKFDCTATDTNFEMLLYDYLTLATKLIIDGSHLAKDYLNETMSNLKVDKNLIRVLPNDYDPEND